MMSAPTRTLSKLELKVISSRLLPTWQTAAAIAQHAGFPARTVLKALRQFEREWALEHRVIRIDGHNEVHMYRRRQMILVMGVSFPLPADSEMEV